MADEPKSIQDGEPKALIPRPLGRGDSLVTEEVNIKIERILMEYRNRRKLQSHGLANRRKILLEGVSGTGKTLTASVIASELNLPLFTVQMDRLVSKFMGETSAKLRQIFDSMSVNEGVYFFDEFDAIGSDRNLDNEVGEMRRILNSFLQFIEQDSSESLIISATNNQKLLDKALFRRFDDVLLYDLPTDDEIRRLFEYKLGAYSPSFISDRSLINEAMGLSHAEIVRVCDDAIKSAVLTETTITEQEIKNLIKERHLLYKEA